MEGRVRNFGEQARDQESPSPQKELWLCHGILDNIQCDLCHLVADLAWRFLPIRNDLAYKKQCSFSTLPGCSR